MYRLLSSYRCGLATPPTVLDFLSIHFNHKADSISTSGSDLKSIEDRKIFHSTFDDWEKCLKRQRKYSTKGAPVLESETRVHGLNFAYRPLPVLGCPTSSDLAVKGPKGR